MGVKIAEGEEPTEEFAQCPACGAIIQLDAISCPNCGVEFEIEEEAEEAVPEDITEKLVTTEEYIPDVIPEAVSEEAAVVASDVIRKRA